VSVRSNSAANRDETNNTIDELRDMIHEDSMRDPDPCNKENRDRSSPDDQATDSSGMSRLDTNHRVIVFVQNNEESECGEGDKQK
jgi:hypothetical protein